VLFNDGRADQASKIFTRAFVTKLERSVWKAILRFAEIPQEINHETSRALTILEEYLEAIERSWEKREQCRAYEIIAALYGRKNDFAKSNVYFERKLAIAEETNNAESEASALNALRHNCGHVGEYGNVMAYLELGTGSGN